MEHCVIIFVGALLFAVKATTMTILLFPDQVFRWHLFILFTLKDGLLVDHVLLDEVFHGTLLDLELTDDFDLEIVDHGTDVVL